MAGTGDFVTPQAHADQRRDSRQSAAASGSPRRPWPTSTPCSSPLWSTQSAKRRSRATSPATPAWAPPLTPLRTLHRRRSTRVPDRRRRSPADCAVRTRPAHRPPQGRTPRPALGRPRPGGRSLQHPPPPPTHQLQRPDRPTDQDPQLRTANRPAHRVPALPHTAPRPASPGARGGGGRLEGERLRLHPARRQPDRGSHPHPALQRPAPPGRPQTPPGAPPEQVRWGLRSAIQAILACMENLSISGKSYWKIPTQSLWSSAPSESNAMIFSS
jgi:hypothetical protein